MADFTFPQFNMPGFPYSSFLDQLAQAPSNFQPVAGQYGRWGGPMQQPASQGLLGMPTSGNASPAPTQPAPAQPVAGFGPPPPASYAQTTPSPGAPTNAAWLSNPLAANGWTGSGSIPVSSLTPQDMLFLDKWDSAGGSEGAVAIKRLLSGNSADIANVINYQADAGNIPNMTFNAANYNGPLRAYYDQWLATNPLKYSGTGYNPLTRLGS